MDRVKRTVDKFSFLGGRTLTTLFVKNFSCFPPVTPFEVIWLDPRDITAHMPTRLAYELKSISGLPYGAVADGCWPQRVQHFSFTTNETYRSLYMRYKEGYPWSSTPKYKRYLDCLRNGKMLPELEAYGGQNISALEKRAAAHDEIYESLLRRGTLSDATRARLKINITPDGEVAWGPDGTHRFYMALIAAVDAIPVKIGFVHPSALVKLKETRQKSRALKNKVRRYVCEKEEVKKRPKWLSAWGKRN